MDRKNVLVWVVCGAVLLWLLLTASGAIGAEWLCCDIPAEPVTGYWVTRNSDAPVWIDYQIVTDGFTGDQCAALFQNPADGDTFTAVAQNAQGRRSDPSNPYVILAKPSGTTGHRMVME